MAFAVYSLFQVDIRNLARNRVYILKGSGLQPSEYSNWPFYEYEFFLDDLNEYIDDMVIEGDVLYVYLNDIMYISTKGLVTNCCDLSYADIDSQNFGNLDEFVKKCEDYYLNSKTFGR